MINEKQKKKTIFGRSLFIGKSEKQSESHNK
jgi:hypothetical protein